MLVREAYIIERCSVMRDLSTCRVISTKNTDHRIFQLVKFTLPELSPKRRTKILEAILDETGAVALIEFISPRGIVRTPRQDFYGVLVFDIM